MKTFFKKWLTDTIMGMGYGLIGVAICSFFPYWFEHTAAHHQHWSEFVIQLMRFFLVTLPILSFIETSIMEFELFSKNEQKRKTINIIICLIAAICIINFFGIFPKTISIILTVVTILFGPAISIIAYSIEDTLKKQDILEINKKLYELNKQ